MFIAAMPLLWRHNGRDSVSHHQPHDCSLKRLFRRRSKKASKLRVTGLCVGNSPATDEFPAQMANNAENVSIWWRHHRYKKSFFLRGKIPTTRVISAAFIGSLSMTIVQTQEAGGQRQWLVAASAKICLTHAQLSVGNIVICCRVSNDLANAKCKNIWRNVFGRKIGATNEWKYKTNIHILLRNTYVANIIHRFHLYEHVVQTYVTPC